jgi:hypothetical protein
MSGKLDRGGCWLAYYNDFSGFNVFGSELLALRFANANTMKVMWLNWGDDPREVLAKENA